MDSEQGFPGGADVEQSIRLATGARERLHEHVRAWLAEREVERTDFAGAV
jgi:hypothetical protein